MQPLEWEGRGANSFTDNDEAIDMAAGDTTPKLIRHTLYTHNYSRRRWHSSRPCRHYFHGFHAYMTAAWGNHYIKVFRLAKRKVRQKRNLKLYYWVELRDGPNETCPIQISRPFVCFELLWANVNTGKIVFDQSEFVLIWKLAENSKRTNDFWAIPQFDSVFQLYNVILWPRLKYISIFKVRRCNKKCLEVMKQTPFWMK